MGDFSLQDTIGAALDIYRQREQSKLDARLIQSREQIAAYEQASKSQAVQTQQAAAPAWLLPAAGFAVLGLVVYMVVR